MFALLPLDPNGGTQRPSQTALMHVYKYTDRALILSFVYEMLKPHLAAAVKLHGATSLALWTLTRFTGNDIRWTVDATGVADVAKWRKKSSTPPLFVLWPKYLWQHYKSMVEPFNFIEQIFITNIADGGVYMRIIIIKRNSKTEKQVLSFVFFYSYWSEKVTIIVEQGVAQRRFVRLYEKKKRDHHC